MAEIGTMKDIYTVAQHVKIPGEAIDRFVKTLEAAGYKIVSAKPVAWRREWDGDVSDIGNMLYEDERPNDNHEWEALYSELGPL